MVFYEHDVADEEMESLDEFFTYSNDKVITIYTGSRIYCQSVCYNKRSKVYSVTTINDAYVDIKKSEVICISDME